MCPKHPRATPPTAALLLALLAAALLAPAAATRADEVHLTNGRSFENVVAEVQGDRVAIRLSSGVIRLPRSKVAHITHHETALEKYLTRRDALVEQRAAAAQWLDLSLWARDHDLSTGYRGAAKRAADLDPDLDGLAPVMRDLELLYDEAADRWLSEEQIMRRRGYVRYDGSWVTAVERAEALARAAEAEAQRLAARREARRDVVLVELATAARVQAETERAESAVRHTASSYAAAPFVYYTSGYWAPVFPAPGAARQHGARQSAPRASQTGDGQGHHHAQRPQSRPVSARSHRGRFETPNFRASDWIPGRLNPGAAPPPGRLTGSTARP
jgi:hypothetical protein